MARCWEINASVALSTPIYQDLGNGWTTALIPFTSVCNPDGAYGTDSFVVDSNLGYIYKSSSQRMTIDEWRNLETAYNCTVGSNFTVFTLATGMSSDVTVYATVLSTSSVNDKVTATETGYYYFLYPSNMTGLTFVIPNKCYTLSADMQINADSYVTNSAFMNNCTFFKIN
jgi:hypothetical protein